MRFIYSASTDTGKIEKGTVDAQNATDAAEQIRRSGLLIVTLRRDRKLQFANILGFGWVTNLTKVNFAKHMSLMIRAGLPIDESIRVLRDQATGRFRRVLSDILAAVESGRPLSDGFADHRGIFSDLFIATIRSGEISGTLEQSLDDLATQLVKSYELSRKIRGAMLYPIIVIVAALSIGIGLSVFVLPKVIKLFQSITVKLPLSTQILMNFSNFMVQHGVLAVLGGIAGIFLLNFLFKSKPIRPFTHAFMLKMPIFGPLIRNYNLAQFSRTMHTLLRSGVSIGEAYKICSDTLHNESYKRALLKVRDGIETGAPSSVVLEERPKLFPPTATRMIAVGERTGKLEETYEYLAQFYEDEVDTATRNLSTILEPVLLIVIGLGVAFIAISIILPIYNFIGNIQSL